MSLTGYKLSEDMQQILDAEHPPGVPIDTLAWENEKLAGVKLAIKKHYMEQQSNTCCYCKQEIVDRSAAHWHLDHIVPRILAPQFTFEAENLAAACHGCNGKKGASEVRRGRKRKNYNRSSDGYVIVHPHYDVYEDHISIEQDTYYAPLTDKGRATIDLCDLLEVSRRILNLKRSVSDRRFEKLVAELSDSALSPVEVLAKLADALEGNSASADHMAGILRSNS